MLTYRYACGDLLENRHTYFYTRFEGEVFLDAWRRERANAAAELANEQAASGKNDISSPTLALLADIENKLSGSSVEAGTLRTLDRLVQRFEVSKRLHGEYNAAWRPVDMSDYRVLERYVRFAEVLDRAYSLTAMLPYLNALLKCLDTLTALRAGLDISQRGRLQAMIACEEKHVSALAAKLKSGCHGN